MKGPTLRGQLTLASILTTTVALLLTAGSLLLYELATYRNAWINDLKTQAELIAHATSAALVFNDPKVATENLRLLELRPSIRAAAIYREEGETFASYRSSARETVPQSGVGASALASQRFEGSLIEVTFPVEHDGERVGTVYVRAEHNVWDRLLGYFWILAAVTAVSLVLAALVFGRLQRAITDPLARVSQVAQRVISRRDWSLRAPETRTRDLSVLVDAFNRMLAEVETATGELEHETL
jgi:methyl-accepting chemotaxis protein